MTIIVVVIAASAAAGECEALRSARVLCALPRQNRQDGRKDTHEGSQQSCDNLRRAAGTLIAVPTWSIVFSVATAVVADAQASWVFACATGILGIRETRRVVVWSCHYGGS